MKEKKDQIIFQKNVSLAEYTAFKIGGKARYFFEAKNIKELILAIKAAKKMKMPFFILGGGSNLLVSDKGFNGLVLKIKNKGIKVCGTKIIAEAGVFMGQLLNATVKSGLSGLEWSSGIPGTIGGAICGNAGAFGKSMKDSVCSIEVLDTKNLKIKVFRNKDCKFDYRKSFFKNKNDLIIILAVLALKKGNKSEINEKIKEYSDHRIKTQPLDYPSAGSVFKNPKGFFAANLIEECGLKGERIGKAEVSKKHANFIVNLGGAKARDVEKLIKLIKEKVKDKFKIALEEEIRIL
jgi:UDP-N-acetylmuramate dehydrogenase